MLKITQATVEVMESHNYNNFKFSAVISNEDGISVQEMDNVRKDLQRLTNKAVLQFQHYQKECNLRYRTKQEYEELERHVKSIKENFAPENWDERQKAMVQHFENFVFNNMYDYEDF